MDIDPQDAPAVYHAMGSDHANPPDAPPQIPQWQFNVPERNREDHLLEVGEEDNPQELQDHPQEVEVAAEEEEAGGHSHYLGTHLPNLLKNS